MVLIYSSFPEIRVVTALHGPKCQKVQYRCVICQGLLKRTESAEVSIITIVCVPDSVYSHT
jgi:hypothetical protein